MGSPEAASVVERIQDHIVLVELAGHEPNLANDLRALLAVVEAAQAIRLKFAFLDGTPGVDFSGVWIPFVESLAALHTPDSAGEPSQGKEPGTERS